MSTSLPSRRRRRWPFVLLAAAVAVVLAVVAIVLTARLFRVGPVAGRADWAPPPQSLLASSMAQQPVPGWTIEVGELGLPDGSRIATSDEAYWSNPLVGAIDDRAYFLARSPATTGSPEAQWWLVGMSTGSGQELFPPARLGVDTLAPKCFLNGPDEVLCLVDDVRDAVLAGTTAWVIDSHTGVVGYSGPARIGSAGGANVVRQVGIYAVALSDRRGVYGVGPSAELTWFVPGDGHVRGDVMNDDVIAPPTRTTQGSGKARAHDPAVVFSVADGAVTTPEVGTDHAPLDAVVYPGGTAVTSTTPDRDSEIAFFDENGHRVASRNLEGTFPDHVPGVPVVATDSGAIVFSPRGDELAKIPGYNGNDAFLVGSTLYSEDSSTYESAWRPYDLKTGRISGPICRERMDGFFASDGTVALFKQGNANVGLVIKAVDLTTCEDRWSMTPPVGSFRDVWRTGTSLVGLSDDGTELFSLVPPP